MIIARLIHKSERKHFTSTSKHAKCLTLRGCYTNLIVKKSLNLSFIYAKLLSIDLYGNHAIYHTVIITHWCNANNVAGTQYEVEHQWAVDTGAEAMKFLLKHPEQYVDYQRWMKHLHDHDEDAVPSSVGEVLFILSLTQMQND